MKYRKKPVIIDAFRWTGGADQIEDPVWIVNAIHVGVVNFHYPEVGVIELHIKTLEGIMAAREGDYIIKGINSELYPCKPDIFAATYEPVEDEV